MTRVIFRTWKKKSGPHNPEGRVIALFPDIEVYNHFIMAYEHIGQHGDADYNHVFQQTKPSTEHELAPLYEELKRIGYNDLKVCKRR